MTILDLKTAQAAYFGLSISDLTQNGQDLGLAALNQVRLAAELSHDFNFQRQLLTLAVDSVVGGSLDNAVLYGTSTSANIKLLLDMGVFDCNQNLIAAEWTTVEEGLERQREEQRYGTLRRPWDTPTEHHTQLYGQRRFVVSNNTVFFYPKSKESHTINVGLEGYIFSEDWTTESNTVTITGASPSGINTTYYRYGQYNGLPLYVNLAPNGSPTSLFWLWFDGTHWIINQLPGTAGSNYFTFTPATPVAPAWAIPDGSYAPIGSYSGTALVVSTDTDPTSDIWTTMGQQYLLWASIIQLNFRFKSFVPRTEGNLAPPQKLADEGLQNLINWDVDKYEQRRRHGR